MKSYGEVVPGYVLVRDRNHPDPDKAAYWALRDADEGYGLVDHFTWERAPAADPHAGMTRAEIVAADEAGLFEAEETAFNAALECLEEALRSYPEAGYYLVTACIQAGYDLERGPLLVVWLCDRMARHVAAFEAWEKSRAILDGSTSWTNGAGAPNIRKSLMVAARIIAEETLRPPNPPPPWVGRYLGTLAQFDAECRARGVLTCVTGSDGPRLLPTCLYGSLTVVDMGDHVLFGDAPAVHEVLDGKRPANQTIRATDFPPEKAP